MTRKELADALYAQWLYEDGHGTYPDAFEWQVYDAGDHLNPIGLTKEHFLQEADNILSSLEHHMRL